MKLLLLCTFLIITCNSNESKQIKVRDSNYDNPTSKNESIFVNENQAQYKHGTNELLLIKIYSSISKLSVDDVINTLGIYQMDIDTIGITSNFRVIKSISKTIDVKIARVCDTLEFYPALLNGKK